MIDPISPDHYTALGAKCPHCSNPIEPIVMTRQMPFNLGNAAKYVMRAPFKASFETDVNKAIWYLNDELKRKGFTPRYEDSRTKDNVTSSTPENVVETLAEVRGCRTLELENVALCDTLWEVLQIFPGKAMSTRESNVVAAAKAVLTKSDVKTSPRRPIDSMSFTDLMSLIHSAIPHAVTAHIEKIERVIEPLFQPKKND